MSEFGTPPMQGGQQGQPPDPTQGQQNFGSEIGLIPPQSPTSIFDDLQYGAELRDATDRAFANGDEQMASDLLEEQKLESFRSIFETKLRGGDPVSETTPRATFIDPQIEVQRRMFAMYERETEIDGALEGEGIDIVRAGRSQSMKRYKERNEAKLIHWKPDQMSDEEKIAFRRQLEPDVLDPNELAEWRQILAKSDYAMKQIDPKLSVFTHPKTQELAEWVMSEAYSPTMGYIQSGAQPVDYGADVREVAPFMPDVLAKGLGRFLQADYEAWEGIKGLSYSLVEGGSALAMMGADRITGGRGEDYWNIPTQAIVERTGEVVHNAGKVHPEVGFQLLLWNRLFYKDVDKAMHDFGKAREWEEAQRHGMGELLMSAAHLGGSLIGFGPAGKAWEFGAKGGMKGLQWLGALGYTANQGPRAKKIIEIVAKTTGAAVAGGTVDGVAYGRHEGFAKAFANGMIATPLYLAIGAMGRGTERWLRQKKMPKKIAQMVAGGMDGAGLGILEINQMSPLWKFIKDPNEQDWGDFSMVMMKNIMTLALVKGMGRGVPTPSEMVEKVGVVGELEKAIVDVSREAYETKDPARREALLQTGEQEGWAREDMLALGEQSSLQQISRGTTPKRSRELRGQIEETRKEATRRKMGLAEPKVEIQKREFAEREQIERLRRAGETLKARGELEAQLERRGRRVPQETMLPGADPISRLQAGTQKRDMPGRRKTEIGMAIIDGKGVPIKGKEGAISVEQMQKAAGDRKLSEISTVHTHPSPTPVSIADIAEMAQKTAKGREAAPDYLVTPEAVYEIRVAEPGRMTLGEWKAKQKASESRQEKLLEAGAKRIASETGVSLSTVKKAMEKWIARDEMSHIEKQVARQFSELMDQTSAAIAKDFGMSIRRVTTAEASKTLGLGEKVEGREPRREYPVEGVLPGAEQQLRQAKKGELADPKRITPERAREIKREEEAAEQGRDPLEDPGFMGRPAGERRRILERRTAKERRVESQAIEEERRGGERRQGPRREEMGEQLTEAEILSNRAFPAAGGPELLPPAERVEGVEPIRVSDLKREMEGRPPRKGILGLFHREGDPIRTPMRVKGFRRSGIMGYFETRQDIIRSKEAYDLNNMAHEWAHAMQAKMRGFDWRPESAKGMSELMELAKPMISPNMNTQQRVAEGWAEFWARDMLGDPNLHTQAPMLYRELMTWMAEPGNRALANQYGRITDAYKRWRLQGAVARAIGEIEPKKGTKKSRIAKAAEEGVVEKLEGFMARLTDDAATFKRAYEKWMTIAGQDPGAVSILYRPGDTYDSLRMTAPRVAEGMLNIGMTDLAGRRTGQSMEKVLGELRPQELERFWAYMKRRRELEMMDKGLPTGVTREEALYVVEALGNPKFERVAEGMRVWFHGLVDYVAESGGLSMEQAESVKDAYMVYMPFQRMFDQVPARIQGRGVAEQGAGIKRMKGGMEPIMDPLVAIREMTTSLVVRAQKARVMRSLHDHHMLVEGQGGFVTDVTRKVEAREVKLDDVADALARSGERRGEEQFALETTVDVLRALAEGDYASLTLFTQKTIPTGKEPVVAYTAQHTPEQIAHMIGTKREMLRRQNRELGLPQDHLVESKLKRFTADVANSEGKLKWLELDVDAYGLMMGIDAAPIWLDRLPTLLRVALTAPAQMVRMGATVFNPAFIARNIARDAKQQGMYSKHGSWIPLSGFVEMLKGMKSKGDPEQEIFDALGGKGTTFIGQEITGPALKKGQTFFAQEVGPLEMIRRGANRIADFIGASEQWLRRREFTLTRERALAEGKTELEANLEALLDAKEVTVNFTRGSAFTRAMNQIFPYFNAGVQGSRKFTRHVLGYEGDKAQRQAIIHGLTHLTSMSALVYLFHGDEEWYQDLPQWRRRNYWNFKLFGDDEIVSLPKPFQAGQLFTVPFEMILDQLTDAPQPMDVKPALIDFVGQYLNNYQVLPALIQPAFEAKANYSTFKNRPIVPEWMERSRLPEDQYHAYTTQAAKWLGEAIGVSPLKIENVISGYSGGSLLEIIRTFDLANNAKETEIPVISSFVKQKEHKQSRYVRDIYDIDREISQASGSGEMTSIHRRYRSRIREAKESINSLKKQVEAGKIEMMVANRRAYEIAKKVVDAYRKAR